MREILFRGKSTDNGEWVNGYYSPWKLPNSWYIGHFIIDDSLMPIEIDQTTLGQYTGLKDKNGTRIFEGDILKIPNIWYGGLYKVSWWKDASFKSTKNDETYLHIDTGIKNGAEVVGNIYDNPELLEVQDV